MERQLAAARYAFHKVTNHKYAERVHNNEISEDMAREMYARAMANYDGIIANALTGNSADANAADMARGFYLDG